LWVGNASIDAKRSSHGLDWNALSKEDVASGRYPYNAFTYNGQPYVYYYDNRYLRYATWTGSAWTTGSTGIQQNYDDSRIDYGADAVYYNGQWCIVAGYDILKTYGRLRFYTSNNPSSSFNYQKEIDSSSESTNYFMPSLNILNGKLVLTYMDSGKDLHWQVYDGVNWVNKGDIEADLSSGNDGHFQSAVKDPVNNQLVCVYIASDGKMYYRTLTDPDGTWSNKHLLFQPASGKTIKYPHASYIDHRLVVTFSYNLRGNYNIYMISAPEYLSSANGGVLKQYNRIQFPDATPNQQHVNSSVFYFKNIDSRAITEINITFADMGSIQCESNFKLWGSTDNSSWTDLGTTDASGILGPINSVTWATGMNWESGEIRYFKVEILDIGSVVEDLHATDEDWIWEITLE